jgi:hypothetical protein
MRRLAFLLLITLIGLAADKTTINESVTIKRYNFSKVDKDAQMWSAMYVGSNGKVYVGLCTHGDAANVYEFDPKTETMRHLANITKLAGERGKGVWTTGKIHVQMQELDGYVYFGSLDEDNGPPVIDANSYVGPHWYRIHMESGRVEQLSLISDFWGLVGQAMDKKRRIIYGLAEDGHLYRYLIDEDYTEDMGRVDNWDICRTIFLDEAGNLYGSLAPGMVWKYDVEQDRIFDLQSLTLPTNGQSRTMANPMLDRLGQWRVIEWDPVDKVAYGLVGGSNRMFKFDPAAGREGEITMLEPLHAPMYDDSEPFDIPGATLAMTLSQPERKIYYIPVASGDFDYGAVSTEGDSPSLSYMMSYDLKTGKRDSLGIMKTKDGSLAYGMGGAQADAEGRIWFVGAFEERDAEYVVRKRSGKYPYSMGLGVYDPRR